MSRPACVTDYQGFHAANQVLGAGAEAIVASMAGACGNAILTIGWGNQGPPPPGGKSSDLLATDLALSNASHAIDLRRRIAGEIGESWLTTCFDVMQRIDREHVADFLLNLAALTPNAALISISTRPSSMANRYHSTVIPIDTWIALLRLAGFSATPHDGSNAFRSTNASTGAGEEAIAVSHWQRVNPFRDHPSHQHYLQLERLSAGPVDAEAFRTESSRILDVAYRQEKRAQVAGLDLPMLIYNVHFMQDWSFARSLMDVWPADRMRILFRSDSIAEPYLHALRNICLRNGVSAEAIYNSVQGAALLDLWDVRQSMFVTATEGIGWLPHTFNSMLAVEASRRGATTVCLQHGMNVSRAYSPASMRFAAWDEAGGARVAAHWAGAPNAEVCCVGSVKFLDALLPSAPGGMARRFGVRAGQFARSVLIGLNLHWDVHENGREETLLWIERLLARNPDTLFLLRTHPDDATTYARPDLLGRPNLILLDELTLLSMDVPVSRILREVDGVITTTSTLILDALAAGRPLALLPGKTSWDQPGSAFLDVSSPARRAIPVILPEEWASGDLPEALKAGMQAETDGAWFDPSRQAIRNLVGLAGAAGDAGSADARLVAGLEAAFRNLNLDENPHRDRTTLSAALSAFVGMLAD